MYHMIKERMPPSLQSRLGRAHEAFLLMRESLENGETLEEAVVRGLQEEFGAEGKVIRYLGSIQSHIPEDYPDGWEKTTLYFHASLIAQGDRSLSDAESHSILEWVEPTVLLQKLLQQGRETGRADLDESKIIKAYLASIL